MDFLKRDRLMSAIAEWHEATFDTTFEEQCIKLREEIDEAALAKDFDEWFKEMADVFFVYAALLYRYRNFDAQCQFTKTIDSMPNWMLDRIDEELAKKFEINKNRKWEKQPDGTYHHVEG